MEALLKKAVLLIIFITSLMSLHGDEKEPSFYIKSIFTTGGRISGHVSADPRGGFLVFSEDRYLYSFYPNGELRSRKKVAGAPVPYHAQGFDGIIYKYFDNSTLKAVNMNAGIIWSVKESAPPAFNPVINSSGNIITVTQKKIISYSYMGRKRWELDADESINQDIFFSAPLLPVTGGIVYAGMSDGSVIVIDNYGQIIKAAKVSSAEITAISINNDRIIVSDKNSNLFILNQRDLKTLNTIKIKSPAAHIIAARDGKITVVQTKAGNLELFDAAFQPYTIRIRGYEFAGQPLYFGNNLYFVKNNGFILKFDINQKKTEEIPIPFEAVHGLRSSANKINSNLAISSCKNMMLAGGLDWNLYIIEERNFKANQAEGFQNYAFPYSSQNNSEALPDTQYLIYINELSQVEDSAKREKAFELLEEILIEKITGNDERYILSILGRVAYGSSGMSYSAVSRIESNAEIRKKTALIAAKIGTLEIVNILRNMLNREIDPVVASVIIRELGKAGSDPLGESVRLFQTAYSKFPEDSGVAENIIMGIKNINSYQGYVYENEGKNLLLKMLDRTEKKDLKLKITDAMKTLISD